MCTHVDFQNLSALPPESTQGNLGFTAEHLTLSRSLPLIRHHKDMEAPPPHSSFSQVTIETRPRKARAVGLDLNSVAAETRHGQTRVDHASGGRGDCTVTDLRNYNWKGAGDLVSHPRAEGRVREMNEKHKKRPSTHGGCVTNVALFKYECCIFGRELKSQMALGRCSTLRMFTERLIFSLRHNAHILQQLNTKPGKIINHTSEKHFLLLNPEELSKRLQRG